MLGDSNKVMRQDVQEWQATITALKEQVAAGQTLAESLEAEKGAERAKLVATQAGLAEAKQETEQWRQNAQSIKEKYQRVNLEEWDQTTAELAALRQKQSVGDGVNEKLAKQEASLAALNAQASKMLGADWANGGPTGGATAQAKNLRFDSGGDARYVAMSPWLSTAHIARQIRR